MRRSGADGTPAVRWPPSAGTIAAAVAVAAVIAAVVVALILGAGDASSPRERSAGAAATPVEHALAPAADGYVSAEEPGTNFGRSSLRVDGTPRKTAFLRFDLGELAGTPDRALLRLYANSPSVDGIQVHRAPPDGWSEDALTARNAPKEDGGTVASSEPFERGDWITVDVTSAIAATDSRVVGLALTTTGETAISLASREQGAHAPGLVLVTPPDETEPASETLLAVGDIASCRSQGDEETAAIARERPGTIATLGDTAYEEGSPAQFRHCFAPSWGSLKPRIRPAPGNHDYLTPGATGYFGYFGAAAGGRRRGYYSYDLGAWHVVVLNSNCSRVGGCGAGSPQEQWLRDDLAAYPATCTLAYWHHPRFSSGRHGPETSMQPIWQALREAGAELVLSGHDHDYERFAPQTETGGADPENGIRQFVVGTGGRGHTPIGDPAPNSEVRHSGTFGVLDLTLRGDGYDWLFLPAGGDDFTDEGSGQCH